MFNSTIVPAAVSGVVSIVVVLLKVYVNDITNRRIIEAKMIEVAVGVLAQEPENGTQPAREWAVDIIERYSDVPLNSAARRALIEHRALDSRTITLFGTGTGTGGAEGQLTVEPQQTK
jgi:hypothetical protein